ncbi:hypothetical protein KIW84_054289 [Lathyrus oleraceus]|uniref:Disease resistance protein At4g27190-like leucine-rich repeats domain-containing protein n=1 Tax=Pisum sativum TaxID=3888 RepID=A0A9D5AHA5_PEA|nr:hypothetical protein KIW84_054289 [Pisum sativum]
MEIIDERKVKETRGEIVADDDDNDRKISQDSIFPKLEHLRIEQCHGLKCIFPFLSIQVLPALESFSISDCEKLQYIFGHDSINNFLKCDVTKPGKQLEPLKCSTFKIPLVYEDQQQDMPSKSTSLLENSFSLNHLTVIKILQCEKLENVFSTSILRCLPQLVALKIVECKELKHIIEDDLENDKSINFESTNTYFPKLEILIVGNCNKLKCVFPTSICKELPRLKVLMIREVYELQDIFKTEASKSDDIDDIDDIIGFVQSIDYECYIELKIQLGPLISDFTCNGKPLISSKVTQESAVGVEAEAASESGSILTSSQPQGVEISTEDGITSTNVKTLTSSTHSKSNSSSSPHLELVSSSFDPSSQKDGDCQIATTETNDEVSLKAAASMKESSNIEEQFPKEDKIIVFESKPSSSITSPIASQFPSRSFKGDLFEIVEDLSSPFLVTRELEQLVSMKHLDYGNLSVLTDFLVKHPSVLLNNTSLSNRYKGYAYNYLAELLKFLQTHSMW